MIAVFGGDDDAVNVAVADTAPPAPTVKGCSFTGDAADEVTHKRIST